MWGHRSQRLKQGTRNEEKRKSLHYFLTPSSTCRGTSVISLSFHIEGRSASSYDIIFDKIGIFFNLKTRRN